MNTWIWFVASHDRDHNILFFEYGDVLGDINHSAPSRHWPSVCLGGEDVSKEWNVNH